MSPPSACEIQFWASQLAGEARGSDWIRHYYVCPEEVGQLARQIDSPVRGLIGLVGSQGVGKSSALAALYNGLPGTLSDQSEKVLFKWRKPPQLYDVFLDVSNNAHNQFLTLYSGALLLRLAPRYRDLDADDALEFECLRQSVENHSQSSGMRPNLTWAETALGKRTASNLRQEVWFQMVSTKRIILIDTPDYSKTDKRRMDSDLNEIYWLWNSLVSQGSAATLVVAIQKEMFRDHFFLDKMQTAELKPLTTEQILDAYLRRFTSFEPLTEDAVAMLAEMSWGIFRRFLRYVSLTLDIWESKYRRAHPTIDSSIVKEAVSVERLTTDMELELRVLFRNSNDMRTLAVNTMTLLQEQKEIKQNALVKQLDVAPHVMSRLLTRLESAKYVSRSWDGADKTVRVSSSRS